MAEIILKINGKEITAREGQTILEAAKAANIEIPSMCHDERVKNYASCGVCVVEIEGMPRLARACSTLAATGMNINTESEKAVKIRKAALELLLSDHKGDCRPPCALACPAQTDCQGYVGLIANGEYSQAASVIREKLPLPASIGRVCPHPCEEACRRELVEQPINIAQLKYFAADIDLASGISDTEIAENTGRKVAVIGGGPGGLTAAYFLRKKGHNVTVYDAMPEMGGMLRYGIPEYRLPKSVLAKEVSYIQKTGVEMVNNTYIGKDLTLDSLRSKFDAVIIAIGAWTSSKLHCPGEDMEGVVGGIDFLRKVHFEEMELSGKKIAVVGGGNTAMDACRTAVRLGAEAVYNIYRRTKNEMPAEAIEIEEAEEEGVIFKNLRNPIEITGGKKAEKIRLQVMELGEPDASGRRSPVAKEGIEEILDVDLVIIAIGQTNNNKGFEGVTLTKRNTIASDEKTFRTNLDGVFAVGDATNKGADIAISAIGEAGKAAEIVDRYLYGEDISYTEPFLVKQELTAADFNDKQRVSRVKMQCRPAEERKHDFNEINRGYSKEEALKEAGRCLECGCHDYFECKLINYANRYSVSGKFRGDVNEKAVEDEHPFIIRNMNKCVLCGLCVRICDEVMGVGALGLTGRGFTAQVMPGVDNPLSESGCISCGQCVAVCPTGALGEKYAPLGHKQVPVKDTKTETVCSQCSMGCPSVLSTKGNIHLRCLPTDGNLLCDKGRFGFATNEKKERIPAPLIRKDGKLTEVTFEEAFKYIRQNLSKYNAEETAVSVSDSYACEEIEAVKKFGGEYLKTGNIVCSNYRKSGLSSDKSTCGYDDLLEANVIITVADDMLKAHTILAVKIKQAKEKGAEVISIFKEKPLDFADEAILADSYLLALEKLKSEKIDNVQNAVFVFVQNDLTVEEMIKIEDLSKGSRNNGVTHGIIQMKPNANTQGLCNLNINKNFSDIGGVKALVNFGDEVWDGLNLEFLCVQSTYYSEAVEKADVVLPGISLIEKSGIYINSVGNAQELRAAVPVKTGFTVVEMIENLTGN